MTVFRWIIGLGIVFIVAFLLFDQPKQENGIWRDSWHHRVTTNVWSNVHWPSHNPDHRPDHRPDHHPHHGLDAPWINIPGDVQKAIYQQTEEHSAQQPELNTASVKNINLSEYPEFNNLSNKVDRVSDDLAKVNKRVTKVADLMLEAIKRMDAGTGIYKPGYAPRGKQAEEPVEETSQVTALEPEIDGKKVFNQPGDNPVQSQAPKARAKKCWIGCSCPAGECDCTQEAGCLLGWGKTQGIERFIFSTPAGELRYPQPFPSTGKCLVGDLSDSLQYSNLHWLQPLGSSQAKQAVQQNSACGPGGCDNGFYYQSHSRWFGW